LIVRDILDAINNSRCYHTVQSGDIPVKVNEIHGVCGKGREV